MSELSLQSDVIKAVNAAGGHAFKASSRYLVGIVDIYTKLPNRPGTWFEVKKWPRPKQSTMIKPAITVPQRRFLDAEIRAGGSAGVISFLTAPNKCWMLVCGVDEITKDGLVYVKDHVLLKNRNDHIVELINGFFEVMG